MIEAGPSRVEPKCAHYEECGGCVLQHVDPAEQTRLKTEAVLQTIRRVGKVDTDEIEILETWSGEAYGYRTRARFAVAPERIVGYRAPKSHRVVDVTSCPILAPAAQRGLDQLRERNVEIIVDANVATAGDDVLIDDGEIETDDGLGRMLLSPAVFAQANAAGNAALVEQVATWTADGAPHGAVVELYAGSGNFTRAIAKHATSVTAIESNAAANELHERTKADHVRLVADDVVAGLASIEAAPVVVMDPPRRGVDEAALERVADLAPNRVIYVSCDPGTFARDLGRLAAKGLNLSRLRVFDLYPHTAHVELVGYLE